MRARRLRLMMFDAEDRQLQVVVRWHPGMPMRWPSLRDPGSPEEPESVEIEEVHAIEEGADVEWPANHEDEVMEAAQIEADALAGYEDDMAYERMRDEGV